MKTMGSYLDVGRTAGAGLTSAANHFPGLSDQFGDMDAQTDFMTMFGRKGEKQHFYTTSQ